MAQSEWAQCASEIRKELKDKWPGIKFRVRSDAFTGGTSVTVSWTDGPTTEQVSAIIDKYQYGHFDGMIDMYEYSNDRPDIPQAKYVISQRSMSEQAFSELSQYVKENYAGLENFDPDLFYDNWNASGRQLVGRLFNDKDFTKQKEAE